MAILVDRNSRIVVQLAEPIVLFVASTVLITAMLGSMSLSGFRPRW